MTSQIAVMRPKLPSAAQIRPYLEKIDAARVYSNFGPLNTALERRLEEHYSLSTGAITTVGNATIGLTLVLAAFGAPQGSFCVMPAWTFVASAHAALMAGLTPYFVDVDEATWAIDPTSLQRRLNDLPGEVGAVMPVAPFGSPVDMAAWDQFTAETGVPVVLDAAAGFDSLAPARTPAVVSLHATKVLGIGEGGFVASTDKDLVAEVRRRSNFGFHGTRIAEAAATNGKLSELHAAVGLAALDEWAEARGDWMRSAELYARALPSTRALEFQPGFGSHWVGSACVLRLARAEAATLEAALERAGVESRRWWGAGAHRHTATAGFARDELPVTERLVEATLAIPFYRDLPESVPSKVAAALHGELAVRQAV